MGNHGRASPPVKKRSCRSKKNTCKSTVHIQNLRDCLCQHAQHKATQQERLWPWWKLPGLRHLHSRISRAPLHGARFYAALQQSAGMAGNSCTIKSTEEWAPTGVVLWFQFKSLVEATSHPYLKWVQRHDSGLCKKSHRLEAGMNAGDKNCVGCAVTRISTRWQA